MTNFSISSVWYPLWAAVVLGLVLFTSYVPTMVFEWRKRRPGFKGPHQGKQRTTKRFQNMTARFATGTTLSRPPIGIEHGRANLPSPTPSEASVRLTRTALTLPKRVRRQRSMSMDEPTEMTNYATMEDMMSVDHPPNMDYLTLGRPRPA
jgi:hypothetical protein